MQIFKPDTAPKRGDQPANLGNPAASSWHQAQRLLPVQQYSLLAALIVIGFLVFQLSKGDPKVTIEVPEIMTGAITVHGEIVDTNYNLSWSMGLTSLVGNLNPKNVETVKEFFLEILSPHLALEMESDLQTQAQIIQTRNIQQVFMLDNVFVDPLTGTVHIWGDKVTFIKGKPAGNTKWTYEWRLQAHAGKPRVVHYDSYAGTPSDQRKRRQPVEATEGPDPFLDLATEEKLLNSALESAQ